RSCADCHISPLWLSMKLKITTVLCRRLTLSLSRRLSVSSIPPRASAATARTSETDDEDLGLGQVGIGVRQEVIPEPTVGKRQRAGGLADLDAAGRLLELHERLGHGSDAIATGSHGQVAKPRPGKTS